MERSPIRGKPCFVVHSKIWANASKQLFDGGVTLEYPRLTPAPSWVKCQLTHVYSPFTGLKFNYTEPAKLRIKFGHDNIGSMQFGLMPSYCTVVRQAWDGLYRIYRISYLNYVVRKKNLVPKIFNIKKALTLFLLKIWY